MERKNHPLHMRMMSLRHTKDRKGQMFPCRSRWTSLLICRQISLISQIEVLSRAVVAASKFNHHVSWSIRLEMEALTHQTTSLSLCQSYLNGSIVSLLTSHLIEQDNLDRQQKVETNRNWISRLVLFNREIWQSLTSKTRMSFLWPTKTLIEITRITELTERRQRTCSRCKRRIAKILLGRRMLVKLIACHIVWRQVDKPLTTQVWILIAIMEVKNFKIII